MFEAKTHDFYWQLYSKFINVFSHILLPASICHSHWYLKRWMMRHHGLPLCTNRPKYLVRESESVLCCLESKAAVSCSPHCVASSSSKVSKNYLNPMSHSLLTAASAYNVCTLPLLHIRPCCSHCLSHSRCCFFFILFEKLVYLAIRYINNR